MNERDFKGVWIPREIWLSNELSLFEKCLLVEIDSLDCGPKHCFKSNESLAEFLGCSVPTVSRGVKNLAQKKFISVVIEKTAFGSIRTIKSLIKMMSGANQNGETPTNQNDSHSIVLPSSSKKKTMRSNTEASLFAPDSEPYRLSQLLLTEHRKIDAAFEYGKDEASIQRWAKDIDKILRLDGRSFEDVRWCIAFSQADGFWASHILSGDKLRKKIPALIAKRSNRGNVTQLPPSNRLSAVHDPSKPGFSVEKL